MIKRLLITLATFTTLNVGMMPVPLSAQVDIGRQQACEGAGGNFVGGECVIPGETRTFPDIIRSVTNLLVFIIGAIAVLMLIIGGLRYVLSGGDSAGVEGAKNTILYALIGIVVAFMAYAIVNFVIDRLQAGP